MGKNKEEIRIKLVTEYDPKNVKQGAGEVEESMGKVEESFDKADKSSKKFKDRLKGVTDRVKESASQIASAREGAIIQEEKQANGLVKTIFWIGKAILILKAKQIAAQKAFSGVRKAGSRLASSIKKSMTKSRLAIAGVAAAFIGFVVAYKKFNRAAKQAAKDLKPFEDKLKSVQFTTGATSKEMGSLRKIIEGVALRTGEDLNSMADYVNKFKELGLGLKESTEAAVAAVNVAKRSGRETSEVVNALQQAYKGSADEAKRLGINVEGITKEEMQRGKVVRRIRKMYGKGVAQASEISRIEAERKRVQLETKKVMADAYKQSEGIRESWALIKLQFTKVKAIILSAFGSKVVAPLNRGISLIIKGMFNFGALSKLVVTQFEYSILSAAAKFADAILKVYHLLPDWARVAGMSFQKLADRQRKLHAEAQQALERRKKLEEEILDVKSVGQSNEDFNEELANEIAKLSNKDTRVFEPEEEKEEKEKKKEEKKEKIIPRFHGPFRPPRPSIRTHMDRVIETKAKGRQEREAAAQKYRQTEGKDDYRKLIQGQIDQLKKKGELKEAARSYRKQGMSKEDAMAKAVTDLVHGQKGYMKKLDLRLRAIPTTPPFNTKFFVRGIKRNVVKPMREAINKFAETPEILKTNLITIYRKTMRGMFRKYGTFLKELPGKLTGALKKLPGMITKQMMAQSEAIVAPSEIEKMDDGTKEGQLAQLEATKANAEVGVESAKEITSGVLDMIQPGLGMILEMFTQNPEQVEAFFESLLNGVVIMVETISKNIGPIISAMVKNIPKVIVAVVKAIPVIIESLVKELPMAIEILINELIKALPDILMAAMHLMKVVLLDPFIGLPSVLTKLVKSMFGFGRFGRRSAYDGVDAPKPPSNLAEYDELGNKITTLRKDINDDDSDEKDEDKGGGERIAPITIKGVEHTDSVLTAAEAFNPYINEDADTGPKQPVKIEIQIGNTRFGEVLTDLYETGYPTVVTI